MRVGEVARRAGVNIETLRYYEPQADCLLHVTNGDSAGNTLRRTSLGGAVLPWQDTLHAGPLPLLAPERLRGVRAKFLSQCGWGSTREIAAELERRDEVLLQALQEGRHVVLWFEHDLYDQLQLLQILAFAAATGFEPGRLELIDVDSFEGRPDFHGLGELEADELETLWPVRRPVTAEIAELGRRGWEALCAPEPTAIESMLAEDTALLPHLAPALRRLLEELPEAGSGLSRSERQVLEILAGGPLSPLKVFLESQAREEAPFEGDAWAYRRIADLGAGDMPLLQCADGERVRPAPPVGDPRSFATTPVVITDAGRAVLDGRLDWLTVVEPDRWVGGTHLRPGSVWRRSRDGTLARDETEPGPVHRA
jgi:hypothetical protein